MPFQTSIASAVLFLWLATLCTAEEASPAAGRPLVTQVGENHYRIGEIELDSKKQAIQLPVTVNMEEGGPIEYFLVHDTGKVHESVLVTKVSPLNLQIALKLLKFKSGNGDVFNRLIPPHLLDKEGGNAEDCGESVTFTFSAEGSTDEIRIPEMVLDGESRLPLKNGDWVYTGSIVDQGNFMAETEGSFIAIYLDPIAMFNMTAEGADFDERWGANKDAIPEIGTKGILTIRIAPTR
tara:strand:- start:726 stop:1436 length:711 start_codon:yes stop_codon:yes gene_type:complete